MHIHCCLTPLQSCSNLSGSGLCFWWKGDYSIPLHGNLMRALHSNSFFQSKFAFQMLWFLTFSKLWASGFPECHSLVKVHWRILVTEMILCRADADSGGRDVYVLQMQNLVAKMSICIADADSGGRGVYMVCKSGFWWLICPCLVQTRSFFTGVEARAPMLPPQNTAKKGDWRGETARLQRAEWSVNWINWFVPFRESIQQWMSILLSITYKRN